MDEDKKNKILNIIKSMKKEGSSTAEIKSTLTAIGLSSLEVDELIGSVSAQPNLKDIHEKVNDVHEVVLSGSAFNPAVEEVKKATEETKGIKQEVNEIHGKVTEHSSSLNSLNDKFSQHAQTLETINQKINTLHTKHEEIEKNLNETSFLKSEIREVKEMLIELKPLIKGMADLQQQLIEINKKMLLKLEKK